MACTTGSEGFEEEAGSDEEGSSLELLGWPLRLAVADLDDMVYRMMIERSVRLLEVDEGDDVGSRDRTTDNSFSEYFAVAAGWIVVVVAIRCSLCLLLGTIKQQRVCLKTANYYVVCLASEHVAKVTPLTTCEHGGHTT